MNTKLIVSVLIALIIGAGGGYEYGIAHAKTLSGARPFAGAGNRSASRAGGAMGHILSIDPSGITISLQNGGSQIILTSASTSISHASVGTQKDLIVGSEVSVQGAPNADGSLTATSIRLGAFGPGR
jgi:Domain of unknown function (DUF5666)